MFKIRAGNPQIEPKTFLEYDMCEAIESTFPLDNGSATVFWNGIPFELHYKYCISEILEDLIIILKIIKTTYSKEYSIRWPSNNFEALWVMKWDSETLFISAEWENPVGKIEEELNQKKDIIINKVFFTNEWKGVILNVIQGLSKRGYDESVDWFRELKNDFMEIYNVEIE